MGNVYAAWFNVYNIYFNVCTIENFTFQVKTVLLTFGQLFLKNGLLIFDSPVTLTVAEKSIRNKVAYSSELNLEDDPIVNIIETFRAIEIILLSLSLSLSLCFVRSKAIDFALDLSAINCLRRHDCPSKRQQTLLFFFFFFF